MLFASSLRSIFLIQLSLADQKSGCAWLTRCAPIEKPPGLEDGSVTSRTKIWLEQNNAFRAGTSFSAAISRLTAEPNRLRILESSELWYTRNILLLVD
jgi:hypothetical protein